MLHRCFCKAENKHFDCFDENAYTQPNNKLLLVFIFSAYSAYYPFEGCQCALSSPR